MSAYDRVDSRTIYSPVAFGLNTDQHRATLDKNSVSLLTGRDPKATGRIARMPGGRFINVASIINVDPVWGRYFQRRGTLNGHIPRTTTTAATNITWAAATNYDFTVSSTAEFQVWDSVVIYKEGGGAGDYVYLGKVTAILSGNVLRTQCVVKAIGPYLMPIGSKVMRCMPSNEDIRVGEFSFNIWSATETPVGCPVLRVAHGCTVDMIQQTTVSNITGGVIFTADGASPAWGVVPGLYSPMALLPVVQTIQRREAILSGSNGEILLFSGGNITDTGLTGATYTEASFAKLDRSIVVGNGKRSPFKLNAWNKPEPLGFPRVNISGVYTVAAAGSCGVGTHSVFVRFVDYSVSPPTKSPPVALEDITFTAGNQTFAIDWVTVFAGTMQRNDYIGEAYRKATHYQIWMTPVGLSTYFLLDEKHLSRLVAVDGTLTGPAISITDSALGLRDALGSTDFSKGLMPCGKYVHAAQGVLFTAGVTDVSYAGPHPKVLSDDIVYYSRVDAEEPEATHPLNFKVLSNVGDEVRGFVDAGEVTLILSRNGYTTVQRMGTYLIFKEGGVSGQGLAYPGAYASISAYAAWMGDQAIWLYDGSTQAAPVSISEPIRDWILGMAAESNLTVRLGFDPVNRLLWVSKYVPETAGTVGVAECMVYSMEDHTWAKMEGMPVKVLVSGAGLSATGELWELVRFVGGDLLNAYTCVDYQNTPIVQGGWSPKDYTLSGTLAAPLVAATSLGGLSLMLPDYLIGTCIFFSNGQMRIISNSTALAVSWLMPVQVEAGETWAIGAIPFKIRLPVIRGPDPFNAKSASVLQVLFDEIDYKDILAVNQNARLTVKLLRNFIDTAAPGASGTLAISDSSTKTDADFAANVETSGKIIEVQLEQVTRHVGFSILYAGLGVRSIGSISEDASTAR